MSFLSGPVRILVIGGFDHTNQMTADVEIIDMYSNTTVRSYNVPLEGKENFT